MKKYNQLDLHQRYQIQALLETEISKSEIAKILGVVPRTIYRELSRYISKRGRTA
jgi:IS30 family transposase